jgi:hypothetical protein
VPDQHAWFWNFNSASLLKQQFMGRHVAPLGQNILIPIQPLLHLIAGWDSEKQQMLILHSFPFATPLQFLLVDKVFQSL